MATIASIIARPIDRDRRDTALCDLLGITEPGAYAIREPDGRLMVWPSRAASENDDGARATYRSSAPITDAEWDAVRRLAWVDEAEVI